MSIVEVVNRRLSGAALTSECADFQPPWPPTTGVGGRTNGGEMKGSCHSHTCGYR